MEKLLKKLQRDFPAITFEPDSSFRWSPMNTTVYYDVNTSDSRSASWSLLHELGHAHRHHKTYTFDFELLRLESEAWDAALDLASRYSVDIDHDHIQDCLDTYRDWLHQRSTCPLCGCVSLQVTPSAYECFNCKTNWKVSASRFCRPYRRLVLNG